MGCTTSSPLVTSGSGMLKAASHVAADATKSAEDAIEDVTQTLGKTIEGAKESVGTAVTGIANELSNTIKEKTDETKATIMEKLHLNSGHEKESNDGHHGMLTKQGATGNNEHNNATDMSAHADGGVGVDGADDDEDGDDDITQRLSRLPTPTPLQRVDSDSLKTTTSEPEIEKALANQNDNSPPTPQPNYSELMRLSAELHDFTKPADTVTDSMLTSMATSMLPSSSSTPMLQQQQQAENPAFQYRPHTTEWEKYADLLAKSRRFHPNEIVLRRRLVGPNGIDVGPTATATATAMTMTPLAAGVKVGTENDLGTLGFIPKPLSRNQSKTFIQTAAETEPEQLFRDLSNFPIGHVKRRIQGDDDDCDESANNESNSSPVPGEWRYSSKIPRKRVIRNFPTYSAKKIHRQLASLIGLDSNSNGYGARGVPGMHGGYTGNRSSNLSVGRYFDFNPNRIRVGSPPNLTRRRNGQTFFPTRLSDTPSRWGANRIATQPIKVAPTKQRPRRSTFVAGNPKPILSTSSSPSRIGLHSFGMMNSGNSSHPMSRSSLSSARYTITPISRTPSKNSLSNIALGVVPNADSEHLHYPPAIQSTTPRPTTPIETATPPPTSTSTSTPTPTVVAVSIPAAVKGGPAVLGIVSEPIRAGESGKTRTLGNKHTSSFLASPRTSSFTSARKSFIPTDDIENEATFVADLCSATEDRNLLTPSPYKTRERCAVCLNNYSVK